MRSLSALAIYHKLTLLFLLETAYERQVSITDQMPDLLGQTEGIRKSSAALCVAYAEETVWQRVTPLESPPLPLNTDP